MVKMFKISSVPVIALLLIAVNYSGISPATAQEAAASSDSYSLEYVSVAASGSSLTTNDYAVVSQVQTKGVTGQTASSEDYSIVPLIGAKSIRAAVTNWFMY